MMVRKEIKEKKRFMFQKGSKSQILISNLQQPLGLIRLVLVHACYTMSAFEFPI